MKIIITEEMRFRQRVVEYAIKHDWYSVNKKYKLN